MGCTIISFSQGTFGKVSSAEKHESKFIRRMKNASNASIRNNRRKRAKPTSSQTDIGRGVVGAHSAQPFFLRTEK